MFTVYIVYILTVIGTLVVKGDLTYSYINYKYIILWYLYTDIYYM